MGGCQSYLFSGTGNHNLTVRQWVELISTDQTLPEVCLSLNSSSTLATPCPAQVHLWGCGINDRGAEAIAEALHMNDTLTELYLFNNKIGDTGAVRSA